jgi:prepilin-type N-terminal cleavage/methylation domain-containing protein
MGRLAGFTLVELVMVIVILGVLSVSFAPRIATLSTYDTRTWSDDLRHALRHARHLALQRGCAVRVDLGKDGYSLWNDARCHQVGDSEFSLPVLSMLDRTPMARPLPEALSIEPLTLIFSADGPVSVDAAVAGADPVTIRVGEQRIQVWPATGRVQ